MGRAEWNRGWKRDTGMNMVSARGGCSILQPRFAWAKLAKNFPASEAGGKIEIFKRTPFCKATKP